MESIKRNPYRHTQKKIKKSPSIWRHHENGINFFLGTKKCCHFQQKNQQNNISEIKVDGTIDNFNVDAKPVNWKLQKLEKDFLLTYLDTALQRYNKQASKNIWLPSRNKDYCQKELVSNCKPYPLSKCFNLKTQGTSSFPSKQQMKHKCSQTENKDAKVLGEIPFKFKGVCLHFMILLKKAIELNDTKPLLDLKGEEINEFYSFLCQLNSVKSGSELDKKAVEFQGKAIKELERNIVNFETQEPFDQGTTDQQEIIVKELEVSKMWEEIKNVSYRVSEPYGSQKDGLKTPAIETIAEDFVEYKVHDQAADEANERNMFESNLETKLIEKNEVAEEIETDIKTMELVEEYNENTDQETVTDRKPSEDSDRQQIDLKDKTDEELKKNLQIDDSEKVIEDSSVLTIKDATSIIFEQTDRRIVDLMTNKNSLIEFLIVVNDTLRSIDHEMPQVDSSSSLVTIEVKSADDILYIYTKISDFINESTNSENPLKDLVDMIMLKHSKENKVSNDSVREIIENPELLTCALNLILNQTSHFNKSSLIEFFKHLSNAIETKSLSFNVESEEFVSDFLYDVNLMANLLVIVQLWNQRSIDIHSVVPTQDLKLLYTGIENMKQWVSKNYMPQSETDYDYKGLYKKSDIFAMYEEYIHLTEQNNKELHCIFRNPKNLTKALTMLCLSNEIISKMNINFRKLELKIQNNKYTFQNLTDEEEQSLNNFLNNEEYIRQILAIVDYWVSENGQDVSTVFEEEKINKDFLINYRRNQSKDQLIYDNLQILINWLKEFIESADPDDTPEEIIIANFYGTNIYLLTEYLNLDSDTRKYFKNPSYLLEFLLRLQLAIHIEMRVEDSDDMLTDISQSGNLKSDKVKYDKTEPISSSPLISLPIGKNKRFSNSEAKNSERYSQDNQESTYVNLSSINLVKQNLERSIDEEIEEKIWDDNDVFIDNESPKLEITFQMSPIEKSESVINLIDHEVPKEVSLSAENSELISDKEASPQVLPEDQGEPEIELSQEEHTEFADADENLKENYRNSEKDSKKSLSNKLLSERSQHSRASFCVNEAYKKLSVGENGRTSIIKSPPLSLKEHSKSNSKTTSSSSIVLDKYELESEKELFQKDCIDEPVSSDSSVVIMERALSFNSQMNILSSRLDNVIDFISSQHEELAALGINILEEPGKESDKELNLSQPLDTKDDFENVPPGIKNMELDSAADSDDKDTSVNKLTKPELMETSNDDDAPSEYKTRSSNRDSNLRIVTNKLSNDFTNYKNLTKSIQSDSFSVDQDKAVAVLENYEDPLNKVNNIESTSHDLQGPSETLMTNLSREPPARKSNKSVNDVEDIIITLSFMVYYLLTIISSGQV